MRGLLGWTTVTVGSTTTTLVANTYDGCSSDGVYGAPTYEFDPLGIAPYHGYASSTWTPAGTSSACYLHGVQTSVTAVDGTATTGTPSSASNYMSPDAINSITYSSYVDMNYTYDSAGRPATTQYWPYDAYSTNPAPVYTYSYDSMGRALSMTDDSSYSTSGTGNTWTKNAQYDAAGRMTSLDMLTATNYFGSGTDLFTTEAKNYNANGQVAMITWSGVPYWFSSNNQQYIYSSTQNNGQITQMVDTSPGETVSYGYDALKRLVSAASTASWTQTFQYDGFGNLTSKVLNGTTTAIGVNAATNRLSSGYYDANGNMTSGVGQTMTYDESNRLASATPISGGTEYYGYAPDNKRIYKWSPDGTEAWYLYGAHSEKLGTFSTADASGDGTVYTFNWVTKDVRFAGKLVDQVAYYTPSVILRDRLGTNRTWAHYPYGEDRSGSGPGEKFATYYRDGFTTLDYADQRYYASSLGRFNTADPYRASAGPGDPGSWNRYAYVKGDPINKYDPRGLDSWDPSSNTVTGDVDAVTAGSMSYLGLGMRGIVELEDDPGDPGSIPISLEGTSAVPITVKDFSNSGNNQAQISAVLGKVLDGLSLSSDCSNWLQAGGATGSDLIAALLGSNNFGHGTFNVNTVAAFAGSKNADGDPPTGVPVTAAFTVNDAGAFFNSGFTVGAKGYSGGTLKAQAAILIHELAHLLGVAGFKADFNDPMAGKDNDKAVDTNCGSLIGKLK